MDNAEAADKVRRTLEGMEGVRAADARIDGQAEVEYDDGVVTVMDLIRSLRRIGFLAGME